MPMVFIHCNIAILSKKKKKKHAKCAPIAAQQPLTGSGAGTGPVRHRGGAAQGLFAGAIDRDHDISERSETAIIVHTIAPQQPVMGPVPARGRCGTAAGRRTGLCFWRH